MARRQSRVLNLAAALAARGRLLAGGRGSLRPADRWDTVRCSTSFLPSSWFMWHPNTNLGYNFDSNANFQPGTKPNRVLKLSTYASSSVPMTNTLYLGYWLATDNPGALAGIGQPLHANLAGLPTGLLSGGVDVEIRTLTVWNVASSGAGSAQEYTPNTLDVTAAIATFYIGAPTRRRLAAGGMAYIGPRPYQPYRDPERRESARRLSEACDPCNNPAHRVYGDANGDCFLNGLDV